MQTAFPSLSSTSAGKLPFAHLEKKKKKRRWSRADPIQSISRTRPSIKITVEAAIGCLATDTAWTSTWLWAPDTAAGVLLYIKVLEVETIVLQMSVLSISCYVPFGIKTKSPLPWGAWSITFVLSYWSMIPTIAIVLLHLQYPLRRLSYLSQII